MPGNNRNNKNRRTRKKEKQYGFYFDYTLLFVLVFIVGFGLTMIYSTSSYTAQIEEGDPEFYFRKQLIFTILGLIVMAFETKFFDYHYFKKFGLVIYFVGLACMFLLKTPLGITRNGATRWIRIPGGQFQPAELVKIGTIAMTAWLIIRAGQNIKKFRTVIVICIIAGILPAGLVYLLSSNLSSALIVALISVVMTFVAYPGYKIYIILTGLAAAAFAGFYSWIKRMAASGNMTGKFRLNRMLVLINTEKYIDDKGYQTVQALYAIGSGGLFGAGLGESKQKYLYLSEPHNDFIFSIIAEELGFVGCILVFVLFAVFIWRGVLIAMKAPDMFGSLVAVGITSLVGVQAIINVAVVTSSMPVTGMQLPFFSYGGTALFILLCEVGVLLSISRAGNK